MNIFILDKDPQLAAQYLANKHVIKMILESAQLLCTAHHLHPEVYYKYPTLYKKTHENHPCAIWCRENTTNYLWLSSHAFYLCEEYTFRYNKIHKTQPLIEWLSLYLPRIPMMKDMTDFPQCMPEIYKRSDVVEAYRAYYIYDKMKKIQCNWTKREKPFWIKEKT